MVLSNAINVEKQIRAIKKAVKPNSLTIVKKPTICSECSKETQRGFHKCLLFSKPHCKDCCAKLESSIPSLINSMATTRHDAPEIPLLFAEINKMGYGHLYNTSPYGYEFRYFYTEHYRTRQQSTSLTCKEQLAGSKQFGGYGPVYWIVNGKNIIPNTLIKLINDWETALNLSNTRKCNTYTFSDAPNTLMIKLNSYWIQNYVTTGLLTLILRGGNAYSGDLIKWSKGGDPLFDPRDTPHFKILSEFLLTSIEKKDLIQGAESTELNRFYICDYVTNFYNILKTKVIVTDLKEMIGLPIQQPGLNSLPLVVKYFYIYKDAYGNKKIGVA